MAILTDLPNELVREVVRGSEKKDLVGFGRISARFRTESQAELFYFPHLDRFNAASFLSSLESNSELSQLVKRLELKNAPAVMSIEIEETVSKLLLLVTELMTLKCFNLNFDCRWLVSLPKLHSLNLEFGSFSSSSADLLSFPSIKNLSLHWIEFENIHSPPSFPLLFPSVTTLFIHSDSRYPIIQPFGQHTKYLYLNSDNVDLESIKLLENLELFHSSIPFTVLCDVLPLLQSSFKQIRIERYGEEDDWSSLVKLFESNLESFQQLEIVYIGPYESTRPEVVDLRSVLEKRKIRLEVVNGYVNFNDSVKLANQWDRNRIR